MKLRLWLKNMLVAGAALATAALVFGFLLWQNPPQDRRELQRIRVISNVIMQNGFDLALQPPFDNALLGGAVERFDGLTQVRIAVYDTAGTLLADSRRESESPLPTWAFFAGRDPNERPIYQDATGREWLISFMPFKDGSVLLVAYPRPHNTFKEIILDETMIIFMRAAVLSLFAVSLLAAWVVIRSGT